jgi:hypothetical protein
VSPIGVGLSQRQFSSDEFNSVLRMLLRSGPSGLPSGTTVFLRVPVLSLSAKTQKHLFDYLASDETGKNRLVLVMSESELQDLRESESGPEFLKKTSVVNFSETFGPKSSI